MDVGDYLLDAADLRKRLTVLQKLQALAEATPMPLSMLERHLNLGNIKPDEVLTIIFTSGSTGDPKGVVLSVENVGSNVRAIADLLHLSPADTALGVLPFFTHMATQRLYGFRSHLSQRLSITQTPLTQRLLANLHGTITQQF